MTPARTVSILASLFVTVIILLYSGMYTTSHMVERIKPPPRPDLVPETAVWCHHPACQIWIDCVALESGENRFNITMYSHPSGLIDFGAEYSLAGRLTTVKELAGLFKLYDGHTIYLRDDRELVPLLSG